MGAIMGCPTYYAVHELELFGGVDHNGPKLERAYRKMNGKPYDPFNPKKNPLLIPHLLKMKSQVKKLGTLLATKYKGYQYTGHKGISEGKYDGYDPVTGEHVVGEREVLTLLEHCIVAVVGVRAECAVVGAARDELEEVDGHAVDILLAVDGEQTAVSLCDCSFVVGVEVHVLIDIESARATEYILAVGFGKSLHGIFETCAGEVDGEHECLVDFGIGVTPFVVLDIVSYDIFAFGVGIFGVADCALCACHSCRCKHCCCDKSNFFHCLRY